MKLHVSEKCRSCNHTACDWCCSPESADTTTFTVQEGDIIILGTDGLFDNMKDDMIMKHISRLKVIIQQSSAFVVCSNARKLHHLIEVPLSLILTSFYCLVSVC